MSNKLLFTRDGIEIHCGRGDTATAKLASQLYPVHKNRINTLFVVSLRKAPEVLELFRGLNDTNISTAPQRIQDIYWHENTARAATRMLLSGDLALGNPVVNEHLTLKHHQQLAREMAMVRDRFAFFYDTRTGKTPLSLAIMRDDILKHPEHKWLVVCPLILIENAWLEDARAFIPDIKVVNCHASTRDKRLHAMREPGNIYIANVESFSAYKKFYEAMGFYGCFVDESSTMKGAARKTKKGNETTSEALVNFSMTVKRWYLLSGAPAPNGEWEYYMQLKSVDPYSVPQSMSQFKEHYFVNMAYNPQYEDLVLRPDRQEELYKILRDYSFYVDKEDVLDTPGRTFHEVEYEMTKELKASYRKMKNELYLELNKDEYITAPSAAAKLNKLNQISSGFVMDTQARKENAFDGGSRQEVYLLSEERFNVLYELLESLGDEQVLIWANYREEFRVLNEHFRDNCRCVYGGTKLEEKNEAIKLFKDGKVQYLIANPASADKGLTLTNAHICVYFSLNWSYELFKQSMERIYGDKSKQPKHCEYYILIAKSTVDGILYRDVLQGKATASTAVLNHLKAEF